MKNMSNHKNSERPPPEGLARAFANTENQFEQMQELLQTLKTNLNKCKSSCKH